jgi:hypothetical protein
MPLKKTTALNSPALLRQTSPPRASAASASTTTATGASHRNGLGYGTSSSFKAGAPGTRPLEGSGISPFQGPYAAKGPKPTPRQQREMYDALAMARGPFPNSAQAGVRNALYQSIASDLNALKHEAHRIFLVQPNDALRSDMVDQFEAAGLLSAEQAGRIRAGEGLSELERSRLYVDTLRYGADVMRDIAPPPNSALAGGATTSQEARAHIAGVAAEWETEADRFTEQEMHGAPAS